VVASGVGVTLEAQADFTGESATIAGANTQVSVGGFNVRGFYQRIIPTKSGTVTTVSVSGRASSPTNSTAGIMAELNGFPDRTTILGSTSVVVPAHPATGYIGVTVSAPVTAGTPYWIFHEAAGSPEFFGFVPATTTTLSGASSFMFINDTDFVAVKNISSGVEFEPAMEYTLVQTPIPAAGTWSSDIIDTQSASADIEDITFTASYPTSTGSSTLIEAGDELDFAGNIIVDESQTLTDHTGVGVITLGSRRYYQTKITLTTTDDRIVPTVSTSVDIGFSTTAEWISDAVDTTGDSTTYNSLTVVSTTPGSSTAVTEIRTAATLGTLGAAPWVAFGSVTVRKFAQIRITLTKSGADLPSITSAEMKWTIVSNIVSEEIDTNVDPAGWDIFQSSFLTNSGTVVFEMRSATTSGGLSGATWYTVTNGNFPTASLPTDQFVQWRGTITATDGAVPVVSSVTIRWFIGDNDTVRAASIFYNKNYYVALAEFGNDQNNVIVQLDAKGKWRLKRGLPVSTLGFFFNDPYFGKSTSGVIGKFLDGLTDLGTDIEIDIRTRAFDFSSNFFDNSEFTKVPEAIMLEGRGTGATYDVSYSVDGGETFTYFIDVVTGLTTYATTNDDKLFSNVFRATDATGARAIIYRIHTDDEFDIKLHRLKMTSFITQREPIITG